MVLVVTSSWAATVPLQPNHRPPRPLSNDRTATASPPAWLSRLGIATRFETTTSRAHIDPPSFATTASRLRSSQPWNMSAGNFPTRSQFAGRYPQTVDHNDCDTPTHRQTTRAPPRDDPVTTRRQQARPGKGGKRLPAGRNRPPPHSA